MQQSRYNIYTNIHKALRFLMCETLTALGRIDEGDESALMQQLAATEQLLSHCLKHLEHENLFIHPIISSLCEGKSFTTAEDHVHHEVEIAELQMKIAEIRAANDKQRGLLMLHFYRDFSVFVAENFIHMRIEEVDNNHLLWANFTDSQLQAIENAIVNSIPPQENLQTLLNMLPNISHCERVELLSGMQKGAPADVFAYLMSQLKPKLTQMSWLKLVAVLDFVDLTCNAA